MIGTRGDVVVGRFAHERPVLDAVAAIRSRGLRVDDVYSPYPIHRLDEAMALRRTRLPLATLVGGVLGGVGAVALEYYTSVVSWPLNVGGKPDNSLLAFVPIAFELTILGAGLLTCMAFMLRCRLVPFASAPVADEAVTDDTFAIVVRCRDTALDRSLVERLLLDHGAHSVASAKEAR